MSSPSGNGGPPDIGGSKLVAVNARRLRELREEREWSQETLAKKACCGKRTVENMESARNAGVRRFDRRIVRKIAEVLGVVPEEIEATGVVLESRPLSEDVPGDGTTKPGTDIPHPIGTMPPKEIPKTGDEVSNAKLYIMVHVTIYGDINSLTEEKQQELWKAMQSLLSLSDEVVEIDKRLEIRTTHVVKSAVLRAAVNCESDGTGGKSGQVADRHEWSQLTEAVFTVEMSFEDFKILREAYQRDHLNGFNVNGFNVREVCSTGVTRRCNISPVESEAASAPTSTIAATPPSVAPLAQLPVTKRVRSLWSWAGIGLASVAFLCFTFFLITKHSASTGRVMGRILPSGAQNNLSNVAAKTEPGDQVVPESGIHDQSTESQRTGRDFSVWLGVAVFLLCLQIGFALNCNWKVFWAVLFCWPVLTVILW
jgi:transcriptional regulator with XRE-family HTH domain